MKSAHVFIENYLGDEVLKRYDPKEDPIGIKYRAMYLAGLLDEAYGMENFFEGIFDRPGLYLVPDILENIESINANTFMLKKFKKVWESWNLARCSLERSAIAMYITKLFTVSRDCMEPLLEKDPYLPVRVMECNFPSEFGIGMKESYPRHPYLPTDSVLLELWDVNPAVLMESHGVTPLGIVELANVMFGYSRRNDWLGRFGYHDVSDFIDKYDLDEEDTIGRFVTPW